tara:strand:- start:77 stop:544 length:468 start_codon:yes stop_codon:yes gene_type:complete
MANVKLGSHPSHGYAVVEKLDGAKQLSRSDSGKMFMIDQSAAFTINLPKLGTEVAGWQAKFVVKTADSNDVHIMGWGLTSAGGTGDSGATNDGDVMVLKEMATTDAGAATATSQDGAILKSGATVGDSIDIFTDGSVWYATSYVADAAHSDDIDG